MLNMFDVRRGSRTKILPDVTTRAAIAQLGERQTEDLKVPDSIPRLCTFCKLRERQYLSLTLSWGGRSWRRTQEGSVPDG